MEINTTGAPREPVAAPDGSRYLRRKTAQKLQRSTVVNHRLLAGLRVLGKFGVVLLVLTFLISVLLYAYSSDNFTVRNIAFHGCKQVDLRSLGATIRRDFPPHILRISLKQLRSRLEQETWIRRVEIRRILPSDLVIHIEERIPATILEIHGELALADHEGVLLDKYDPKYGKLDVPVFKGVLGDNAEAYKLYQQENSERVRMGLKMLAELESGSMAFTRNISEVDISDKTNLCITLVDDAAEIFLGDRDFLKRFQTLMSNMSQYRQLKEQYNDIASVDLRFDGQIIYRPRRNPTPQTVEAQGVRP